MVHLRGSFIATAPLAYATERNARVMGNHYRSRKARTVMIDIADNGYYRVDTIVWKL